LWLPTQGGSDHLNRSLGLLAAVPKELSALTERPLVEASFGGKICLICRLKAVDFAVLEQVLADKSGTISV